MLDTVLEEGEEAVEQNVAVAYDGRESRQPNTDCNSKTLLIPSKIGISAATLRLFWALTNLGGDHELTFQGK